MDEDIKKAYQDLFNKLEKNDKEAYKKMIEWAEKFGRLGEATKNQLTRITKQFDKPLYQTKEFYSALIIAGAIIGAILIAIFTKSCLILSLGDYGLKISCVQNTKNK